MAFDPTQWSVEEKDIPTLIKSVTNLENIESLVVIFGALLNNRVLAPSLRFTVTPTVDQYLKRWINAYLTGLDGRPSLRKGKSSTTVPDSLVKELFAKSHKHFSQEDIDKIAKGHSTMMTLENIVGDFLEEYLNAELKSYGWHCCWGKTIKAVDFCHEDGSLLQIKTSDNSENSSSKGVRNNTSIQVWQRRKSKRTDQYYWEELQKITGNTSLSENGFRNFVFNILEYNDRLIYVDGLNSQQDVSQIELDL